MSISATRKVSNTSAPAKRSERYVAGVEEHPFVENVDTTNNVFVRDENRENGENHQPPFERRDTQDEKNKLLSGTTYIPSAIEALSASGVYENMPVFEKRRPPSQIDVYGNNQSIVKDKDDDRSRHSYLKHFYEKNEIIEEVDEFV